MVPNCTDEVGYSLGIATPFFVCCSVIHLIVCFMAINQCIPLADSAH